jgi:hypothetical protein
MKKQIERSPETHPQAHRQHESLLEFAGRRSQVNQMSVFLKGLALEDAFFIGLQEEFEPHLHALARMLGWGPVALPRRNDNRSYRSAQEQPSAEIVDQIVRLNDEDMRLYERAVALRAVSPMS